MKLISIDILTNSKIMQSLTLGKKSGSSQHVNLTALLLVLGVVSLLAVPQVATASEGYTNGNYGLTSTKTLVQGSVSVAFYTYSGEKDSNCGSNAWSIQANTNYWVGGNGHDYMVQFVYQNNPAWFCQGSTLGYSRICIWQIDVTTDNYATKCSNVPMQQLANNYVAYVYGSVNNGILTATFEQNLNSYSVTATDNYGLSTHWNTITGTIYGLAGTSSAIFTSPTLEYTTVGASGGLTSATVINLKIGGLTAETNNLNYQSAFLTGCNYGTCYMQAKSTN